MTPLDSLVYWTLFVLYVISLCKLWVDPRGTPLAETWNMAAVVSLLMAVWQWATDDTAHMTAWVLIALILLVGARWITPRRVAKAMRSLGLLGSGPRNP